jgi:50S ribosomal subunit-associated GTPase HflX
LILHVIDASDPKITEKIKVVDDILDTIGASQDKKYIFNKTDNLSPDELSGIKEKFSHFDPIYISTKTQSGFDEILELMLEYS